jgi:hypothetical protein
MKKLDDRLPISELVKTVAAFDPMVRDVVLTKNEATIAINEVYKKFQAFRYATIVSYMIESIYFFFSSAEKKELIFGPTSIEEEDVDVQSMDVTVTDDDLMQLFKEAQTAASAADPTVGGKLSVEISHYLDHKTSLLALDFWRKHRNEYPLLASMARVYLCICAGSIPVESLFSLTGNILNSKRCSLAPSRCNMISFIHDNIEFI